MSKKLIAILIFFIAVINCSSRIKDNEFEKACLNGNFNKAKQLIGKYPKNQSELTRILHNVIEIRHLDIVELLIDNGADINACTSNDWTALSVACWNGDYKMVDLLISKGANINDIYNEGSPFQIAILSMCSDDKCFGLGSMAKEEDSINIVKLLISKNADINTKDKETGITALMLAVLTNKLELVKLLVEKGVDINAKDRQGMTALHYAKEKGSLDIVNLLISKI